MPLETLKFHLYSLRFTPYAKLADKNTSSSILKDTITYLTKELRNGQGHLIDKNRNRKNESPREIFMTSAVFMHKERRIRCGLALLRSGRVPKIKPIDEFKLVPIKTLGSIAEETHFFIDFSRNYAVICIEYNYFGPRISDVEYYLRNVARDTLKLSKTTDVNLYMSNTIDKTLENLKNVLNMQIKIQPSKIAQMDNDIKGQYFTGINTIGNRLKPNFIKVETLFQTPGNTVESKGLNKEANSMVKTLIGKFKARPFNIDCFDDFVVKYEDKEGNEEVFNLLKGKKELEYEVEMTTLKKRRHWYELIEKDFDEFMVTFN
ncbi:hypothetical protein HSX10_17595 [Winogradskyella undariae]|uniref:hypothetical protein n=1 Tax=Winogradskyella undariae TaxID=1285465 RepID=UPI00156AE344|nr:hypothetical protein [Winogradskyella undariae]NRR93392.1 hypothetical protein [Winogradskyella undariae]